MGTKLSELATASSILSSDKLVGLISSVAKTVTLAILESQIFTDKAASTGVPDATKFPKALGADLVALITAAGYSLAPATGTDNLDNIADGTTYKRVLAAVATALNGGTYTAPGSIPLADGYEYGADLSTYDPTDGSWWQDSPTNGPVSGNGLLIKFGSDASVRMQFFLPNNGSGNVYKKKYTGGVWLAWSLLWDSGNDGNGGQPPAPKPTLGTPAGGADAPGQFYVGAIINAGDTVYFSGATNKTGTWMARADTKINASGLVDFDFTGESIGSGSWFNVPAGRTTYVTVERL